MIGYLGFFLLVLAYCFYHYKKINWFEITNISGTILLTYQAIVDKSYSLALSQAFIIIILFNSLRKKYESHRNN